MKSISILCYEPPPQFDAPGAYGCANVAQLYTAVTIVQSADDFPDDLSSFDVAITNFEAPALFDTFVGQLNNYVDDGGGWLLSLPLAEADLQSLPPGFGITITNQFWPGFPTAEPPAAEFTNAGMAHPILSGTTSDDWATIMTIPISTLGSAWTILARSIDEPDVTMAVGEYGAGRLVFVNGGIIWDKTIPDEAIRVQRQAIEWAAQESSPEPTETATPVPTIEPTVIPTVEPTVESDDTDGDGIPNTIETFFLGTDPNNKDTDGDGLLDPWEVNPQYFDPSLGYRDVPGAGFNLDGKPGVELTRDEVFGPYSDGQGEVTAKGRPQGTRDDDPYTELVRPPNPLRKDIYLELDWQDCVIDLNGEAGCPQTDLPVLVSALGLGAESNTLRLRTDPTHHAPNVAGLKNLIQHLDGDPRIMNPDGRTGINLHILVDERTFHVPNCDRRDSIARDEYFGTAKQRAASNAANILAARANVFRYVWSGHSTLEETHEDCEIPGAFEILKTGAGLAPLPAYDYSPYGEANVGGRDILVSLGPLWICPSSNTVGPLNLCGGARPSLFPAEVKNLDNETLKFDAPVHRAINLGEEDGLAAIWSRTLARLLGQSLGIANDADLGNDPQYAGGDLMLERYNWPDEILYAPPANNGTAAPEIRDSSIFPKETIRNTLQGRNTTIAVNRDGIVVEIHQGPDSNNNLYWTLGRLTINEGGNGGGRIAWFGSGGTQYDTGQNPSVAITDNGTVVEVHNGHSTSNAGNLYYNIGQVDEDSIEWLSIGNQYDTGLNPSIAVTDDGQIVEIHSGERDLINENLYYNVGQLNGDSINWLSTGNNYDTGHNPTVAVSTDGQIVEIHNGVSETTVGSLYYSIGQLNEDSINWLSIGNQYDTGRNPTVSITDNGVVVDIHTGRSEANDNLYYNVGQLDGEGIVWSNGDSATGMKFDKGRNPAAAVTRTGTVIEIHNADSGNDNLFYGVGQSNASAISFHSEGAIGDDIGFREDSRVSASAKPKRLLVAAGLRTTAANDSDGDGFVDPIDNCPQQVNPTQSDLDGDGAGDLCDDDADGDGLEYTDAGDPMPLDTDNDGMPNVDDPDDDGDDVVDTQDNCYLTANPGQTDADGDEISDGCDMDADSDGLHNAYETLVGSDPVNANSLPEIMGDGITCTDGVDNDLDGLTDAQDSGCIDSDGDSAIDELDSCPNTASQSWTDSDDDGVGDPCDETPYPLNTPPAVSISALSAIQEGARITVSAITSPVEFGKLTVRWDFNNDGIYGTYGQEATIDGSTLDGPGRYPVRVKVSDEWGLTVFEETEIQIENAPPAIASLDYEISISGRAVFAATITDPGTLDGHSATWDWGDGSTEEVAVPYYGGVLATAHNYADGGPYVATLTVTDDDGGTASQRIVVQAVPVELLDNHIFLPLIRR